MKEFGLIVLGIYMGACYIFFVPELYQVKDENPPKYYLSMLVAPLIPIVVAAICLYQGLTDLVRK